MRPVVVFTAYDRPQYLYQVLKTWEAVRGVQDALLIFLAEPADCVQAEASQRLIASADFAEVSIRVNYRKLGCEVNTATAVESGFAAGADFVVAAEDDLLVAADVLEYMAWAQEKYADDESVMAVCAAQHDPPGRLRDVCRTSGWFYPHVWGIWRDRWEKVRAGWPPSYNGVASWDAYLLACMQAADQVVVQPMVTRSSNIGEWGTYQQGPLKDMWDRQQFTPDIEPQEYRELPGVRIPLGPHGMFLQRRRF